VVAHICNPSYLGDGDGEDQGLRPAWTKSYRDPISINKLDVVACGYHPSYMGGEQNNSYLHDNFFW
jgi:hypothetical protein